MFEPIESFCEKVHTTLDARDMQGANCLWSDEVLDKIPTDVNMWPIVKDRIVGQSNCASVIWVNANRVIKRYKKLLANLFDPCTFLASNDQCIIFCFCSRQCYGHLFFFWFPWDMSRCWMLHCTTQPELRGVQTLASACVLHPPHTLVQVFQVYSGDSKDSGSVRRGLGVQK